MIHGIGVDVVSVERIRRALDRWKEKFMARIFTEEEIAYCLRRRDPVPSFSVRFAAKEAFYKALGKGQGGGIRWKEVWVSGDGRGRPSLRVSPERSARLHAAGIMRTHVSLTHDGGTAAAFVVLEK